MEYTELENKIMTGIKNTWGWTGAENTYLEDVSEETEIDTKQARGVISSLIKKGIILECLPEHGHEINLTEDGEKLLKVYED